MIYIIFVYHTRFKLNVELLIDDKQPEEYIVYLSNVLVYII